MKTITFSEHAEVKFEILARHEVIFTKEQVVNVLSNPDIIVQGYKNRLIAQKSLDETHVLRVVYEEYSNEKKIITFYPAGKERYES